MTEFPRARGERVDHPLSCQHRSEGNVSAADALAHHHDVRRDAPVLDCQPAAGATVAGQHLIGDEQHVVLVTDLPDPPVVAGHRHDGRDRRADDGLGDERGDAVRPFHDDHPLKVVRAGHVAFRIAAPQRAAVAVRRHDMRHGGELGQERLAPGGAAGQGQRGERAPVEALPSRDDLVPAGPAALQVVLPGHLDRGLVAFRAAGDEIDARGDRWVHADERLGEAFLPGVRERGAVDETELAPVPRDGVGDLPHAVPEHDGPGAADRVQDLPPGLGPQVHPGRADDRLLRLAQVAVEHRRAHRAAPPPAHGSRLTSPGRRQISATCRPSPNRRDGCRSHSSFSWPGRIRLVSPPVTRFSWSSAMMQFS